MAGHIGPERLLDHVVNELQDRDLQPKNQHNCQQDDRVGHEARDSPLFIGKLILPDAPEESSYAHFFNSSFHIGVPLARMRIPFVSVRRLNFPPVSSCSRISLMYSSTSSFAASGT